MTAWLRRAPAAFWWAWPLAACAILAAAVAVLAAATAPKQYTAEARLVFRPSELDAVLVGRERWRKLDPSRIAASRASLLGAGGVAELASRRLPDRPAPRSLDRAVRVTPVAGSEIALVEAQAPNPRRAAAVANVYADAAATFLVRKQRAGIADASRLAACAPPGGGSVMVPGSPSPMSSWNGG